MIRKAIVAFAAVVLATGASIALGPVAGAQYAPTCSVTVNPTSAAPGETVTVSGTLTDGTVGQEITFSINDLPLGSATTDADGNFSAAIAIPVDLAPGSYTIVADCGSGPDGETFGNTEIMVTGTTPNTPNNNANNNGANNGSTNTGSSGNQSGGSLARTGTDLGLPVQVGVALLALGGIALALSAARRRSGATT